MRTIKEITTKHRQNGNKLFYIGRKEQGIEETVKKYIQRKVGTIPKTNENHSIDGNGSRRRILYGWKLEENVTM